MLIKLQRKGQMVIPQAVRDKLGLVEGTPIKVSVHKDGKIVLTPQHPGGGPLAKPKDDRYQVFDDIAVLIKALHRDSLRKAAAAKAAEEQAAPALIPVRRKKKAAVLPAPVNDRLAFGDEEG